MKKKTMVGGILLALAVLVALTGWHFATRTQVTENSLRVEWNGSYVELAMEELELSDVAGSVVNGKGEEKKVAGQGVLLSQVLAAAKVEEFSTVTVTAGDAYSASLTQQEVAQPDKVYLLAEEDGSMRLIVFGDPNSKRRVSDVKVVAAW